MAEQIEQLFEVYDKHDKFVALFLYKADADLFKRRNGYQTVRVVKRATWNRTPPVG